MTVKARDVRLKDLGWGLNVRVDWGNIQDNQAKILHNMRTNKEVVQSIEGYEKLPHPFSSNERNKGTIFTWEWVIMLSEPQSLEWPDGFYAQPFNITTAISPLPTFIPCLMTSVTTSFRWFGWNDLWVQYICFFRYYDDNWKVADEPYVYKVNDNGSMDKVALNWVSGLYSCGIYYEGRLILGWNRASPWIISFSQTASTVATDNFKEFWTPWFEQMIGEGDEVITGLAVSSWKLLALTKKSIYGWVISSTKTQTGTSYTYSGESIASTTPQYTTSFQCVFDKVSNTGNYDAGSFVNVNHDLFFFDWSSIRRLGYEENISAIRDSSISDEVDTIFSSLPFQNRVVASYVFPLVKFFFRSKDKPMNWNDFALVYNVMDKSFSTQTIWVEDAGRLKINNEYVDVFMSSYSTQIMRLLEEGISSYDGEEVREKFQWKDFSVYDDVDYKRYTQVEFSWEATDGTKIEFNIYVDGRLIKSDSKIVDWDKSPTVGAITFWEISLGSNSPSNNLCTWTKRIELFKSGQTITLEINKIGNGFIRVNPPAYRFREDKSFPIH